MIDGAVLGGVVMVAAAQLLILTIVSFACGLLMLVEKILQFTGRRH